MSKADPTLHEFFDDGQAIDEALKEAARDARRLHTERQLLYVACTRARDRLSISAVEPASEFLDDVRS